MIPVDNHEENSKDSLRLTTKKSLRNQVASLQKSVKSLKSDKKSLNNKYIRALADSQNLRHQTDSEENNMKKYDGASLAKSLLPEIDNLKRALKTNVTSQDALSLKKGVKMVLNNMIQALKNHNIKPMHLLHKSYDPHYAQAVKVVSADDQHPSGSVTKVLRNGYSLHDRVIRPAIVVIAK